MPVEWGVALVVILVALFTFMAVGLPIAFSMGLVGFLGLFFLASPKVAVDVLGMKISLELVNFVLLALPLFVLMGQIVIFTRIAADLYTAMEKFFGNFPAGLALATVGAGTAFAAVSGSSAASCATIGPVALKEMVSRGYNKGLAAGSIAAAGGLAIIIPPSLLFILYGFIAEVSVAKLFMAGIIPGLMMATGYFLYILLRMRFDPAAAPHLSPLPLKERVFPLIRIWPVLVLAFIVLGSMYGGIATPTEAAAVGVLGALVLSIGYREFTVKRLYEALMATAQTTGFILLIVVGALLFGFLMSYLRLPQQLTEAAAAYALSPIVLLVAVNIVLLFLGCIMDAASLILVVVPIVLPALMVGGFDPIWLGVLLGLNIEMGLTTPPVGMNLFVLTGVGAPYGITYLDVVRGAAPFLLADAAVLILLIIFPWLALWIPNTMG